MADGGAVLVLNAGSSSLKYRLVAADSTPAAGTVERIGEAGSPVPDHRAAVRQVLDLLPVSGERIVAVGHRIVHGGQRFHGPVRVSDSVLAEIRELTPLAPLHNPAGLAGIEMCRELLPGVPQVAVFDTSFHVTLPAQAATYALDVELAGRYGIRRYGFHGISHEYVSKATARLLGRPIESVNSIVLHLGNGASAAAVAGGRSVETSMGMTPLSGLVMGTRTGDIDPAVVFHLAREAKLDLRQIEDLFQRHGGLVGLCGVNDMREVLHRAAGGDDAARLALDVYCHRIRKYVGAYTAVLGRLDAIAFTAGVGEHAAEVRSRSLAGLGRLGIAVDPDRNASGAGARVISPHGAPVSVCVVPTDEERAVAEATTRLLATE